MYFDDFNMDMRWELGELHVTREEMLDFAGKYNLAKIHTDPEVAKKNGFADIIAQGVMTDMSMWNRFIKHNVQGEEFVAGTACRIEWYEPVYAGDVLTGEALVHEMLDRNEYNGRVIIRINAYNQHGVHVLSSFNYLIQEKRRDK